MVDVQKFTESLKYSPIIAILRGATPTVVCEVAEVLITGGIRFLEVTLNSPRAIESIQILSEIYSNRNDVFIGAGTVVKPEEVVNVAQAGGTYIISPNTDPVVIRKTKELRLISIPGFYSPTEAFVAIASGADLLKCFPVRSLGEAYLKDIKAVVPKPVIAVGGVDRNNMNEYLKTACAVGIGSNLYSSNKSMSDLKHDVIEYIQSLRVRPTSVLVR